MPGAKANSAMHALKCEKAGCCLGYDFVEGKCNICGYPPAGDNQMPPRNDVFMTGIYHLF